MESNNEIKDIDVKNRNFDYISLDEKSYKNSHENILIYDFSYKNFMGKNPLRIKFNKANGFIIIYDGIRYLLSFGPG